MKSGFGQILDTLSGREGLERPFFIDFDQCQEITVEKVCIAHSGSKVSVSLLTASS